MNVFLYVDATSGGMLLQVLLSGAVGGLVAIRLFGKRLFYSLFHKKQPSEDVAQVSTDDVALSVSQLADDTEGDGRHSSTR